MIGEDRIREIARRVAAGVLSERGRASHLAGRPETPGIDRLAGVHVVVHPSGEPLRPSSDEDSSLAPRAVGRSPELVTAQSLKSVPDGGRYVVARGAIVSDFAREEAWKRRIVLVAEGARSSATRGDSRLRVAIGADHGGFVLKEAVIEWVRDLGHLAFDLGTRDENPVDYPDYARAVAEAVSEQRADLGIAIDAAGIGSAIAANKVPNVRAAMCYDVASAKNAREHNHANVLTLGGKAASARQAREIVRAFLTTDVGGERHARRVQKISAIESSYSRPRASRIEEARA
jgi:ribose 5-phosphate isomerase B